MVYTFIRVQFYCCVVTSYDSVSTNDVKNPDHSLCGFTINELPILFIIIHNVNMKRNEEQHTICIKLYVYTRLHLLPHWSILNVTRLKSIKCMNRKWPLVHRPYMIFAKINHDFMLLCSFHEYLKTQRKKHACWLIYYAYFPFRYWLKIHVKLPHAITKRYINEKTKHFDRTVPLHIQLDRVSVFYF